jgi:hypothetical protein
MPLIWSRLDIVTGVRAAMFTCALLVSSAFANAQSPSGLSPEQEAAIRAALGAKPGQTVEIVVENSATREEAKGKGASGTATGDQAKLGIDGSAPGASLSGGGSATGGSVSAAGESRINASLFGNPLLWVGILCWLGAGVAVYLRLPIRVAIIAGCAGVAFICAALFPAATLLIVGGVAACGLAFWLWSEQQADKGAKAKEALRAVVAGIANATPTAAEMVKSEVSKQATEQDKAVIKSIKKADDLA